MASTKSKDEKHATAITASHSLAHAVLFSDDILPSIIQQADYPTLLVMQGTCTSWRQASEKENRARLCSLLGYYFDTPSQLAKVLVQCDGCLSGSSLLRVLFPHDLVSQRAMTDLDLYVPRQAMEAVRDYLVGSGYVLVNRPLSSTIDAAVLSEAMGQALQHVPLEDVYDIPPISRVWKFQRNGRMVDLIGCRYEPTSVIHHFYCTLTMNAWTGKELICFAPHLTFEKQIMVFDDNPKGQELIKQKWIPCGFSLVEGPLPQHMIACTSALDILKGSDPDLNKLRRKPWMLPTDETSRNWSSWAWGC